jgi:hypothetical protein
MIRPGRRWCRGVHTVGVGVVGGVPVGHRHAFLARHQLNMPSSGWEKDSDRRLIVSCVDKGYDRSMEGSEMKK